MSEKNFVINVKTKAGTIFTVRADSAAELNAQVQEVINNATNQYVVALEDLLVQTTSATPTPAPVAVVTAPPVTSAPAPAVRVATAANLPNAQIANDPVAVVQQTLGAEVISETPVCKHGTRVYMNPANKPWSGWFCADKNAVDKCNPIWDAK